MNIKQDKISLSDLLYATRVNCCKYNVTYRSGVGIGTFERGDDGYLYYWTKDREGFWDSTVLSEIAKLLDHLNKPWDNQVRQMEKHNV